MSAPFQKMPVRIMQQMDCTKVMVGSIIEQPGWTGRARITIYGDSLVLFREKDNVVLRYPSAPRNTSFEPYISQTTFDTLIEKFVQVSVEHTPIIVDNSHLAQLRD